MALGQPLQGTGICQEPAGLSLIMVCTKSLRIGGGFGGKGYRRKQDSIVAESWSLEKRVSFEIAPSNVIWFS